MNTLSLPQNLKIQDVLDYPVVGWGDMIVAPTIANGWWIVPAHEYEGRIPKEGYDRFIALVNSGVKVKGLVIMDDYRKIEAKEEARRRREKAIENLGKIAVYTAQAVGVVALGSLMVLGYALSYDPALVAILEDGRWVCVYAWYD